MLLYIFTDCRNTHIDSWCRRLILYHTTKRHRTASHNECFVNPTGNPGMAVGGSGDVLAGMITSLLGIGLSPLMAAACGAWLHGAAGDLSAERMGQYAMLPTDMLEELPRLLK